MRAILGRLEDFRLLPIFVVVSMAIGVALGNALAISDFALTPPIEAIIVEVPSEEGPYGARIVGEPSIVAGAAAVANAVADAVGIRMTEVPVTPERLLRAMGKL